jgi:hypothetical protein
MINELENRLFESDVVFKLETITGKDERINFLRRKNDYFLSMNCCSIFTQKRFDLLIEIEQDKQSLLASINDKKAAPIPFSFYLKNIEKKDELIMLLKERYPNAKNKQCAVMLAVLYENDILDLPDKLLDLYNAIAAEWKIEDFDRRGHEQILKKWWIQITKEWLQTHTPQYSSEVRIEIEYLKTKIKEIESKKLIKN